MAAQRLHRDLLRPTRGLKKLAQTTKKEVHAGNPGKLAWRLQSNQVLIVINFNPSRSFFYRDLLLAA